MKLRRSIERYVNFKRQLGYAFDVPARVLYRYSAYAAEHADEYVVAERAIAWASQASSLRYGHRLLATVRRCAVWLHAEDQRHEVPPADALNVGAFRRPTPSLLSPTQIRRLMDEALRLGPSGSITPYTYYYMIGLVAGTGMRRAEVVALKLSDITPDGLLIREGKFRKSRLIPLHVSTRDALNEYLDMRLRVGAMSDRLFIISTGGPPHICSVNNTFIKLARRAGLRGGPGEPGPRMHDLRHSFAVRSLEEAVDTDRDNASRHMLALSTYLGHSKVAHTYWYLEATPVLLQHIARETEESHQRRVGQ